MITVTKWKRGVMECREQLRPWLHSLLQYPINPLLHSRNWGPWSDSHRRIRVYETRPVAAEAQGQRQIRRPKETRIPKAEWPGPATLRTSAFSILSDFGLRISDFYIGALTWICTTNLRLRR